jgi:hypothetical protein
MNGAQRSVSRLATGGIVFAVMNASAVGLMTGQSPQPDILAGCPNGPGILWGKESLGAFTTNCDLVITAPPAIGAAPSAGVIVACRNVSGCLSNFVNSPGWVRVPNVDNRPRSSP